MFNFFKSNFYFLLAGSSLLHGLFSSCGDQRVTSSCRHEFSHCGGLSCCGAQALWCTSFSSRGPWALEHRLTSCGARAQWLCGMWDFPRPRIEPTSPALSGGVFTTEPPGKPNVELLTFNYIYLEIWCHYMQCQPIYFSSTFLFLSLVPSLSYILFINLL